MKQLGPFGMKKSFLLLLAVVVLASPLFFAPFWQPGYQPADPAPLRLADALRVDLNTADEDTLCLLPGIGPAKAKAIVEYREQHGPFVSLEQVALVKGVSPKMVERWDDLACLSLPSNQ